MVSSDIEDRVTIRTSSSDVINQEQLLIATGVTHHIVLVKNYDSRGVSLCSIGDAFFHVKTSWSLVVLTAVEEEFVCCTNSVTIDHDELRAQRQLRPNATRSSYTEIPSHSVEEIKVMISSSRSVDI